MHKFAVGLPDEDGEQGKGDDLDFEDGGQAFAGTEKRRI